MHWKFESVAAFGQMANEKVSQRRKDEQDESFRGDGETFDGCVKMAVKGNTQWVPEAEKLLEKINASIETTARQWNTGMTGFFPCVPDYVAGHPEHMRYLEDQASENAPLRIFVCGSSSQGIPGSSLLKRGVAILAAVMALARLRPVELWTMTALDGKDGCSNIMVKINAAPLQLSEAAVAFCSSGYNRLLANGWAFEFGGFTGGWASQGRDEAAIREILGPMCQNDDLVIPAVGIWDYKEMIETPVAWVNKTLERFQVQQEMC